MRCWVISVPPSPDSSKVDVGSMCCLDGTETGLEAATGSVCPLGHLFMPRHDYLLAASFALHFRGVSLYSNMCIIKKNGTGRSCEASRLGQVTASA